MELREITAFLQVAQLKSFSKAARSLGYSQAAVTIQIKQLEEELQVHLFDRIGKQTTLTHQGEVFYEYASAMMRDLAEGRDAISASREPAGRLRLGAIESICSSLLPPLIMEYHRRFSKVSVSIRTDSPETLLEMMNKNAIDIVYFLDRPTYDSKWERVLDAPEDILFVTRPDNPLAGRREVELSEIISQPFLLTEKDASYRFILEQYLASLQKEIRPFLEIGNTDFIIRLLRQGGGVSLLPEFTVREDIREGRLVSLSPTDFHMRTWRQMVYHKEKWVTREMAAFIELVREREQGS